MPGQHRAQAQPIHGSGGGRPQGEHRDSTQPIDGCAQIYHRASELSEFLGLVEAVSKVSPPCRSSADPQGSCCWFTRETPCISSDDPPVGAAIKVSRRKLLKSAELIQGH